MHNDQLNSVLTHCELSLNLYRGRGQNIQQFVAEFLKLSFVVPCLDLSAEGAGRDQKDFDTWENITVGITFGLCHYMKHMAHLQNLKQLRVTWGANAIPKGKARVRGLRIVLESHAYILVAVPAGFPLGLLQDVWKKWLLVNLRQFLRLMIPLNRKKSTLVFLLNLCLFPALLLQ